MMKLLKKIWLLVFLSIGGIVFGQYAGEIIVVEKVAKQRLIYVKGSEIAIKTREGEKIQGTIFEVTDSAFRVANKIVALKDIAIVYVPRNWAKLTSNVFLIGGGGYIALDALNNVIAGTTSPLVANNVLVIGSSAIAAGLLSRCFITKKLHVGKWKIRVLDFSE